MTVNQTKTPGAMVRRVCHACVSLPRNEYCGICDAEQPPTAGAMVLVPREPTETMMRAGMDRMSDAQRDGSQSFYAYASVCWEAMIAAADDAQPPAVGGGILTKEYQNVGSEDSTDNGGSSLSYSHRDIVANGVDGRVADTSGGEPAVGGEPEVLGYSVNGNRYAIRLTKAELLELYEGYTGDALIELIDRAHVAQLLAEIVQLRCEVSKWRGTAGRLTHELDQLKFRIAELEAAQGEALWYVTKPAESLAGIACRELKNERLWVEIRDLNSSIFPDMAPHDYYPVGTKIMLRQAQPATAKVVLPERREEDCFHSVMADKAKGWNACLDEVAKLNGSA